MDTVFSPVKGLDGSTCTQVFFGIMSRMINVYHMPSKESIHIVKAYQDFMRYEGVPHSLHRDLAPEQKTDEILELNRKMIVKDTWSEAGIPEQNPVEQGGVRILKNAADIIIQRTGAIPESWPWVYNYIADVNNHCASKIINWKTPIEKRHGYTPDISALLLYQFWEPVYFLTDEKTPNSKERKGRWMGISPNVGDCLTYYIYCEDTRKVLSCSVIRTADPQKGGIINRRLDPIITNPHNEPDRVPQNLSDSGEFMKDLAASGEKGEITMQNSKNIDSSSTSGELTTRKSPRLQENMNPNNIPSDKTDGELNIHTRITKPDKIDSLKHKLTDYMKQRNISKKKAKQRLKYPQRQSNRKYGTWDKISTRSMNKSNNNTVQINTTI